MKNFTCSECQQLLFFENVTCTRCARMLAYLPDCVVVSALAPVEPSTSDDRPLMRALSPKAEGKRYRLCRNYVDHAACNWAIAEHDDEPFCLACRLNVVIPDLSDAAAAAAWKQLECSKRRLIYALIALRLPIESRNANPETGLGFAFKQDKPGGERVFTGHEDGLITINIAEADTPLREKVRVELGEAYRTLLGHFRHEIGHYYWDRLIKGSAQIDSFRQLFGDERADYAAALKAHYERPEPMPWNPSFVSAYASMHPWEDWAETFAHYLHMIDTLDTARTYGLALRAKPLVTSGFLNPSAPRLEFDDFEDLTTGWFSLTIVLNSFSRSMGLPDLYPFVLSEQTIEKLRFVHQIIDGFERSDGVAPRAVRV